MRIPQRNRKNKKETYTHANKQTHTHTHTHTHTRTRRTRKKKENMKVKEEGKNMTGNSKTNTSTKQLKTRNSPSRPMLPLLQNGLHLIIRHVRDIARVRDNNHIEGVEQLVPWLEQACENIKLKPGNVSVFGQIHGVSHCKAFVFRAERVHLLESLREFAPGEDEPM